MGSSASASADNKAFVSSLVAQNPVVVFSKTYCPYCTKAKSALDRVGGEYTVVELDTRDDGAGIQAALADLTGQRTVPNVFISGSSIGGGTETEALERSGKLAELVAAARTSN